MNFTSDEKHLWTCFPDKKVQRTLYQDVKAIAVRDSDFKDFMRCGNLRRDKRTWMEALLVLAIHQAYESKKGARIKGIYVTRRATE